MKSQTCHWLGGLFLLVSFALEVTAASYYGSSPKNTAQVPKYHNLALVFALLAIGFFLCAGVRSM